MVHEFSFEKYDTYNAPSILVHCPFVTTSTQSSRIIINSYDVVDSYVTFHGFCLEPRSSRDYYRAHASCVVRPNYRFLDHFTTVSQQLQTRTVTNNALHAGQHFIGADHTFSWVFFGSGIQDNLANSTVSRPSFHPVDNLAVNYTPMLCSIPFLPGQILCGLNSGYYQDTPVNCLSLQGIWTIVARPGFHPMDNLAVNYTPMLCRLPFFPGQISHGLNSGYYPDTPVNCLPDSICRYFDSGTPLYLMDLCFRIVSTVLPVEHEQYPNITNIINISCRCIVYFNCIDSPQCGSRLSPSELFNTCTCVKNFDKYKYNCTRSLFDYDIYNNSESDKTNYILSRYYCGAVEILSRHYDYRDIIEISSISRILSEYDQDIIGERIIYSNIDLLDGIHFLLNSCMQHVQRPINIMLWLDHVNKHTYYSIIKYLEYLEFDFIDNCSSPGNPEFGCCCDQHCVGHRRDRRCINHCCDQYCAGLLIRELISKCLTYRYMSLPPTPCSAQPGFKFNGSCVLLTLYSTLHMFHPHCVPPILRSAHPVLRRPCAPSTLHAVSFTLWSAHPVLQPPLTLPTLHAVHPPYVPPTLRSTHPAFRPLCIPPTLFSAHTASRPPCVSPALRSDHPVFFIKYFIKYFN